MDLRMIDLSPYSTSFIQTMRSLLQSAIDADLSTVEVLAAVDLAVSGRGAGQGVDSQSTKCPQCGSLMQILPVNTHPANQVDGDFTHVAICTNRPQKNGQWRRRHCGYMDYR